VKKVLTQILQGTLDLMILRTLATMGPQHAYGIANRLLQISDDALNLNQGTIYPALVRLEQRVGGRWQV
jgi:PadR family transcriptional regulator PadR